MKIHGTAKGGALSKKDFGVAFSSDGGGAYTCGDVEQYAITDEDFRTTFSSKQYMKAEIDDGAAIIDQQICTMAANLIQQSGDVAGSVTTASLRFYDASESEYTVTFGEFDVDDDLNASSGTFITKSVTEATAKVQDGDWFEVKFAHGSSDLDPTIQWFCKTGNNGEFTPYSSADGSSWSWIGAVSNFNLKLKN